jgi:hypothetical protein
MAAKTKPQAKMAKGVDAELAEYLKQAEEALWADFVVQRPNICLPSFCQDCVFGKCLRESPCI